MLVSNKDLTKGDMLTNYAVKNKICYIDKVSTPPDSIIIDTTGDNNEVNIVVTGYYLHIGKVSCIAEYGLNEKEILHDTIDRMIKAYSSGVKTFTLDR